MKYIFIGFLLLSTSFSQDSINVDSIAIEIEKYVGYDKIADIILVAAVFMNNQNNNSDNTLSYSTAIMAIVIKAYTKYKLSVIISSMKAKSKSPYKGESHE